MKRIAALILIAVFGSHAAASDLPLPTGMASTSPSVPAPILSGGLPAAEGGAWSRTSFRERLGVGTTSEAVIVEEVAGPRTRSGGVLSWRPLRDSAMFTEQVWCEPCAPNVRKPLPPLPGGLSNRNYTTTGSCDAAKPAGSCCQKLKDWLCFHYTPVRTPLIPTQKQPALYTYFPTQEGPGVCAGGNCATGHCATGHHGIGKLRVGSGPGCVNCPAPGDPIVAGFRLAHPEGK
jgi:hypothetical protein